MSAAYSQTDTTAAQIELRNHILQESKKKGQLDFFTSIKGQEYDGIQIKPGIYESKLGFALIKWGKANYELGVKSLAEASQFFRNTKEEKFRSGKWNI